MRNILKSLCVMGTFFLVFPSNCSKPKVDESKTRTKARSDQKTRYQELLEIFPQVAGLLKTHQITEDDVNNSANFMDWRKSPMQIKMVSFRLLRDVVPTKIMEEKGQLTLKKENRAGSFITPRAGKTK